MILLFNNFMVTETITSDLVISYANDASTFDIASKEILGYDAFKQIITYRRYDLDEDNITGGLDRDSYNDYSIYGSIDLTQLEKKITKTGEVIIMDGTLFIPREITKEYDDTAVTPFVPQLHDRVKIVRTGDSSDVWYELNSIEPDYMGINEISITCYLKRVSK